MTPISQNCPECKQAMTVGHMWREHPPKSYLPSEKSMARNSYFQILKEKGYTWSEKEKRWLKGEWVDPPMPSIQDEIMAGTE